MPEKCDAWTMADKEVLDAIKVVSEKVGGLETAFTEHRDAVTAEIGKISEVANAALNASTEAAQNATWAKGKAQSVEELNQQVMGGINDVNETLRKQDVVLKGQTSEAEDVKAEVVVLSANVSKLLPQMKSIIDTGVANQESAEAMKLSALEMKAAAEIMQATAKANEASAAKVLADGANTASHIAASAKAGAISRHSIAVFVGVVCTVVGTALSQRFLGITPVQIQQAQQLQSTPVPVVITPVPLRLTK